MEPLKEPISVRNSRLYSQIVSNKIVNNKSNLVSKDGLLDALTVLYSECNNDCLKKSDRHIADFVSEQRVVFNELASSRVNIFDFDLKHVVGRGHFGEVFVVKEKQTSDIYAMKIIKKWDCLQQKHIAYKEERDIMACTTSAWLTKLQYSFQDVNNLYFIMEYMPGGDLTGLLYRQGGTIPESATCFYIAELVLALNDLHKMGYVHRDVKPENILLDRLGHLKLADFGSAAKINSNCLVQECIPVGTPDYIAPEVLQCMDSNKKAGYGISCDYWSVGVLSYRLIVGNTPFSENNTTGTYAKIMNHSCNLKFPPEILLSQAFVSLINGLVTDQNTRLNYEQILKHPSFKNIDFDGIRDQVPPYVPKISSVDDTSNFHDIPKKKIEPNIENFKSKTQFSGKNLPFIGFTYTQDLCDLKSSNSASLDGAKRMNVTELQKEIKYLQKRLVKSETALQDKETLEKKIDEKVRKIDNLENLRNKLERDLASSISESGLLKRTIELERKERTALEQKALELIKSAKLKWENIEKCKVESFSLEIAQQKEKIMQLTSTNSLLNEQLQHALEMQHKHRDSIETVEHFNRKSIIGLESRLEKVTLDLQSRITELQNKLIDEVHQKNMLTKDLDAREKAIDELKEKLRVSEEDVGTLSIKLEGNQKLIAELENKVTFLDECARNVEERKKRARVLEDELVKLKNDQIVGELEQTLKSERDANIILSKELKDLKEELNSLIESKNCLIEEQKQNYTLQLQDVHNQLSKTLAEASQLEVKLQEAKTIEINNQFKVKSLEDLLERLESGLSKLSSDNDKENVLKQQIERLEKQLIQVHETLALEKQQLNQLKPKVWRLEKDLNNAEIDKRILKRELKESEDKNKTTQEEVESLKEKMSENTRTHESALTELGSLNDDFAQEIVKLKDRIGKMEGKLQFEKDKFESEHEVIAKLRTEMNNKDQLLAAKCKELQICQDEQRDLLRKIEKLERENREAHRANSELNNCRSELHHTQLNLQALREACTLLEDQLLKYENMHASYEKQQMLYTANTDKLIRELTEAKEQIQSAKKMANEERSLKLLAETQCKRLVEDVQCMQNEASAYKQQCIDYRQYSTSLTEEVGSLEEKISDYEVTIKSYERQISNLVAENGLLIEEHSEQLTNLNNTKDSNYQLGIELTEIKKANNELMESINELQDILNQKSNYHKERELKADSTIQQQIKLIDFLQSKIEECKKKKTLSDKLFGHAKKENAPPTPIPLNYKDLENLLLQERDTNKSLQNEITKLKAQLNNKPKIVKTDTLSPRVKISTEKLTETPNPQRSNSRERMHHNLPHSFESKLCTKTVKCVHCSNPISLGRNMKSCMNCHIAVHPFCAQYVPKTCGVPQSHAKQLSDVIDEVKKNNGSVNSSKTNADVKIEGWVKIPVKGSTAWDRHYACLTSTALKIYAQPPNRSNISPIDTLELQPLDGHGVVVLEPVISEISTPVAVNDLPFVIKIQISPNSSSWPSKSLILMTLSLEDKEKWSKALTEIFHNDICEYRGDVVLKLSGNLNLNCLVELNSETKLLGTEQGLYSYRNNELLHIVGPLHVYQISILSKLNVCLMIADSNRYLISCNLNHVVSATRCASCSQPSLIFKSVNVNNLCGFHLFEWSTIAGNVTVSLSTSKQLFILNYDQNLFEFVPVRVLDTAEPTSCMLFTEHTLIVGANKYFEIDLSTFEAEEFLDLSNKNLCQVMLCYEVGSFPIAIMKISNNPIEYLLCFNEFAVFVDEYGRYSRISEIKWNRLPQAFYYDAPYLHVVQFASVEVIKITPETCNILKNSVDSLLNVDCFTVATNNVQYLGNGKKGVYIVTDGKIKFLEGRKLDSDSLSVDGGEDDVSSENCSDEFSFTSSMVHSLDGHGSDTESQEAYVCKKRVTFEARTTNL